MAMVSRSSWPAKYTGHVGFRVLAFRVSGVSDASLGGVATWEFPKTGDPNTVP